MNVLALIVGDILLWYAIYRLRRPAMVSDVWGRIDRNMAFIEAFGAVIVLNLIIATATKA